MNKKHCNSTQEEILEVNENPDRNYSTDNGMPASARKAGKAGALRLRVTISGLLSVKTTPISRVLKGSRYCK